MSVIVEDVTVGDCRLILGDCMEVMPLLQPASFAALMADPPYKMEIHGRGFAAKRDYYSALDYGTSTDFELSEEYYQMALACLAEKNMLFFCSKYMKLDIENWAITNGYSFDELVLCKSSPAPLTNNQWLPDKEFAVHVFNKCSVKGEYATKKTWFVDSNYKDESVAHPSAKPVYILERIIKNVTNKGDLVLDTFMGSGSAAIACAKQGRKFTGIEVNPQFFADAVQRVTDYYRQPDMFLE